MLRTICVAVLMLSPYVSGAQGIPQHTDSTMPVATKWLLEGVNTEQKKVVEAVMMIMCPATHEKGTAFILKTGQVVTAHHVVDGCMFDQLHGLAPSGKRIFFSAMYEDRIRDIALLKPFSELTGGVELSNDDLLEVETKVSTWGYPLTYNGPPPLLSVGYVAGFRAEQKGVVTIKYVIVNGAFNPGNSGGPLLDPNGRVVGLVVAKHHLFPPEVQQAISALANNQSGLIYTKTDSKGNKTSVSEAQVVASVLEQFYKATQVMIGEAIYARELRNVVAEHGKTFQ